MALDQFSTGFPSFDASPDRRLYTAELFAWCYPRLSGKPSDDHRRRIVRAAQRVAARIRRDWPGGVLWRANVIALDIH